MAPCLLPGSTWNVAFTEWDALKELVSYAHSHPPQAVQPAGVFTEETVCIKVTSLSSLFLLPYSGLAAASPLR